MYTLVVHGGAGDWRDELKGDALEGVRAAAAAGRRILARGGPALDAVVAAVSLLEDRPLFNAGTGSALNSEGEAEMDAGVMVGHGLRTGNVACLRRVRNPVRVARAVMERTDHVLLCGEGALKFARSVGFGDYDPVTQQRRGDWETGHCPAARPPALGTVGAVALDVRGELAAATSTGGVSGKLPGRIGDSPVPGAGNYANSLAAVSATGSGELMLRFQTAKAVCDGIGSGLTPQQAVKQVLASMAEQVGTDAGIICADSKGGIGIAHRTRSMPHAWVSQAESQVCAALAAT